MSELVASATRDIEAEQAVLGSMLIDADCVRPVQAILRQEDFALDANRRIWAAIMRLYADSKPIDALTVLPLVSDITSIRAYLAELMEVTPTSANVLEYAEIVANTAKRRRLRDAMMDALTAIDRNAGDDEIFPHVEAAISAYDDRSRRGVLSPIDVNDAFYAHRASVDAGTAPYVSTGYPSLDQLFGGGLLTGNLFFLAARPGTGKTAFALNLCDYTASKGKPVLLVSMEMSAAEVQARRIAMLTQIDSKRLLMQTLNEQEYDAVGRAASDLSGRPLYIKADGALTVQHVASIVRSYKGLALVVIDHFTLFQRPHRQADPAEYAELSHALKDLARKSNVPILCLIQVSRDDNSFKGKKRARLESLRGSGATEEDAAGVLFIENVGEVKNTDGAPREEKIILEKYRFGPTGEIKMSFRPKYNIFAEIADGKATMRKYVALGLEAKERNHRDAARELGLSGSIDGEDMPF